jgi:hypothetical protein
MLDKTPQSFPNCKATGRTILIKFNCNGDKQASEAYLLKFITALQIIHLVKFRVGSWWNSESATLNVKDKVVRIGLRRRE